MTNTSNLESQHPVAVCLNLLGAIKRTSILPMTVANVSHRPMHVSLTRFAYFNLSIRDFRIAGFSVYNKIIYGAKNLE